MSTTGGCIGFIMIAILEDAAGVGLGILRLFGQQSSAFKLFWLILQD